MSKLRLEKILLGLFGLMRLISLGHGLVYYLEYEACDCVNNAIVCDEDKTTSVSVSSYLSKLVGFGDVRLANKNWPKLELDTDYFSFSMMPGLVNLTLDSNNIESIHREFFSTGLDALERLNLDFNELTDCFDLKSVNLQQLSLMGNKIERLSESCFEGLNRLKEIELNRNMIVNLDWDLKSLPGINRLDLSYNRFTTFHLQNAPNLKYLIVSFNDLNDYDLTHLEFNLKSLEINSVGFESFPNFDQLDSLQELKLEDQFIPHLDAKTLRKLPGLQSFSVSRNLIDNITNFTFNYSTSLLLLDLSSNQIKIIEANAFTGLSNLSTLNLMSNQLETIQAIAFRPLIKLQELNLNFNRFSTLQSDNYAYLSMLQTLHIAYNNLNFIKKSWFVGLHQLVHLNLSFNSISHIDSGSFDSLSALYTLDLSYNCLYQIKSNTFDNLPNLFALILNENVLANIDTKSFARSNNLSIIDLKNNQLWNRLPTGLFQYVPYLQHLDLSSNHFSKINSDQFKGLNNLKELNLANNYLTSLDSSLDTQTTLELLHLSSNQFHLAESSDQLNISTQIVDKLIMLDLSNNNIDLELLVAQYSFTKLESLILANVSINGGNMSVLGQFKGLKCLDLSQNHLEGFNVVKIINEHLNKLELLSLANVGVQSSHLNFSNLNKLNSLDLSVNLITEIPVLTFQDTYNIIRLNLSRNQISFIDRSSLSNMTDLVWLDLSSNRLKTMSGIALKRFPRLRDFRMDRNLLEDQNYKFYGSTDVTKLDLSNNKLTSFSLGTKQVYKSLESLYLSNNLIQSLSESSFEAGVSIIELDLSHNMIEEIPENIFKYLNRLEKLYLNHNKLSELPEVFEYLTYLEELNLQYNHIKQITMSHFWSLKILRNLDISFNSLESINGGSFYYLNQLLSLNIAGNENVEDFDDKTFEGLSAIRLLVLPRLNQNNFRAVLNALKPRMRKKIEGLGLEYYESIDIVYSINVIDLSESDCEYSFELIRVKIKLNLLTSNQFNQFLATCQTVFHSLSDKKFPHS